MTVPYWVQDAVFYQIFPDRFANGDVRNDPPNVHPWGSEPTVWNFMGGDLRGVIQHFDYLLDLGITAIYFNPIFLATSNHRYNISDYYRIDPKLGDMDDFRALLEVAHRNDVRVIVDGVFNHCGRGFFAFNDALENGEHSPYKDWFHISEFPVNGYDESKPGRYKAWWNFRSLPKFNTDNPAVRNYIFDVARYWIEQGADGWRLDVPNEIDDDTFWAEFRHVVKSTNREAYIFGEIWEADPRWVGDHHCDGLMNYPVREALMKFLQGEETACEFADRVEGLLERYPRENVYAMYVPLGSHDTERLMTLLGEDIGKVKLAFAFQFAYPGAPAIYYGDEVGMKGGKDPDCRRAFPWDREEQNEELRSWVKRLISLRKRMPSLRRGEYQHVFIDRKRCTYAFARVLGDEVVLVVLNASSSRRHLRLPVDALGWNDGRIVRDLLGTKEYIVSGDELIVTLKPWGGIWVG
ncbi:MAG: glycoside hydrolase family 13 protein [Chloroflexota bacterium]|nr:glycoside hydrolase family 13 protein [Chloroflexota bacterium]